MHILFLSDNFFPEGNAPASRTYEHSKYWVKKGHSVTVVTSSPNFPEGILYEGYKNSWLNREKIEGINVWRVKTFISSNEGFISRIIDYVSFMFSSFIFSLFIKKVDIIVGTSPQFFTVISAWLLSKFKKVPFIFELRDIWPASITAVGAMNKNFVIKFLEKIEIFLYKQADCIVTVTKSFKDELIERGICKNKIKVIFNGVDLSSYKPIDTKDLFFSNEYKIKQHDFVAGYIGTLGLAHSLVNIVYAAEILKKHEDIKLVIAGSGAEEKKLRQLINLKKLNNIVMIPRQSKEKMSQLYSLCNLSIVQLKDSSVFKSVIPSKIFESMAMRLPIIISVPRGEATEIIDKSGSGLVISPENPEQLANAIIQLKMDNDLYRLCQNNSFKSARFYERKALAQKMLSILEDYYI